MGEEFEIVTSSDDPAFPAHDQQVKAAARDALLDADQYVLIVVKDRRPQRFVSVQGLDADNWVSALAKAASYIFFLDK